MSIQSIIPLHTGAGEYCFEVLLNIGLGTSMAVLVQITPQLIQVNDQAVVMESITQFRALGSVVGLAIGTNVFNDYVRSHQSKQVTLKELTDLLQSVTLGIKALPPGVKAIMRSTFDAAHDLQTKVMIGFAVAQVLAVSIMWERKLGRLI